MIDKDRFRARIVEDGCLKGGGGEGGGDNVVELCYSIVESSNIISATTTPSRVATLMTAEECMTK